MRQLFLNKGTILTKEVTSPVLDDHMVLVATSYSCLSSGTETAKITQAQKSILAEPCNRLHQLKKTLQTQGLEGTLAVIEGKVSGEFSPLGYSLSGQVIAIGKKVRTISVGDWVACAGSEYAYHAEIVAVPEQLTAKVSDERFVKEASLTTLGAIALQGIRRAQLQLGEFVAIIGLGVLGQLTIQLARQAGARVIAVDLISERLELAKTLGAEKVYHARDELLQKDILSITSHYGVDSTIITAATDSHDIIQQAMVLTRKKGRVVVVGDIGLYLQRDPFYEKELDLAMSCSYGPGRYDNQYEQEGVDYPYPYVRWTEQRNMQAFVSLLEQKKLDITSLITHEYTIDQAEHAYMHAKDRQGMAILIRYDQNHKNQPQPSPEIPQIKQFYLKNKSLIRVGVIGCGGFSKTMLIPTLAKMHSVKLSALVDTSIHRCLSLGKVYGIDNLYTDYREILQNDLVDAVVIASTHRHHAEQAIQSLSYGKAVFLEKPLAISMEQWQQLSSYIEKNPYAPLCVDFNRSYSPFLKKIKQAISKRTTPLIINYRMSVEHIASGHWIQTEEGGGRIVGEACHIVSLFLNLTKAKAVSISVEPAHLPDIPNFSRDNFLASIRFDDGSICSLTYTTLGHASIGKEYAEIHTSGLSIVMDNYRKLQGFGTSWGFSEKQYFSDKGHAELIKCFFDGLQKDIVFLPFSLDHLLDATYITLVIDDLVTKRGGEQLLKDYTINMQQLCKEITL
ncbi:MAG TPA: bi-domain-containing oxidoreductase [Candidatus Babeliaceae bacterium]|nr:bi-domain-containing oxidoreductase [Candidatus Babeliaceae bacterium]